MPPRQIILCSSIVLLFCAVIMLSLRYGPSHRVFISPARVVSVTSSTQLETIWNSSGVKGRTLVCFTRYLNVKDSKEPAEIDATERALKRGVVRRVFHIVPDNAWAEVSKNLSGRPGMRHMTDSFIGIFESGRVYIQPFSKRSLPTEESLLVLEPKIWSEEELDNIVSALATKRIDSDLVAIVIRTDQDAAFFRKVYSTLARQQ